MKGEQLMQNSDFQLIPYDLEMATIEELKAKYMDITIPPGDKAAYAMVMSGLRECREMRLEVDEWHKGKKTWIVKAGKHYDQEKRRVHALIEPIENPLKAVREAEDGRVEAIRQEKIRQEEERVAGIRAKIEKIKTYIVTSPNTTAEKIKKMLDGLTSIEITQEDYQEFAEGAKRTHGDTLVALTRAYNDRMEWEKAEEDRKAEQERLMKKIALQEEEAKKLAEERRKIEAEKQALEDAKRAEKERIDRAEFERVALEKAKADAEAEIKAKAEREALEKAEAEEKAKVEKARQEALKPDREKLIMFADKVFQLASGNLDVKSEEARAIFHEALNKIMALAKTIKKQAEAL